MRLTCAILSVSVMFLVVGGCDSTEETDTSAKLDPPVTNSIGMRFQKIPAGEFEMGSKVNDNELPIRTVKLTEDYFLGVTEVTQGQWQQVMGTTPWKDNKNVKVGANVPATYVSWKDAMDFCQRLGAMDEGASYRLPTEAEWEYACRAGSKARYCFGNGTRTLKEHAWYRDNAPEGHPQDVATKSPNPWGLYDMHGNVNEWCHDWYTSYVLAESVDPNKKATEDALVDMDAAPQTALRVVRGGAWYYNEKNCRSSFRDADQPSNRNNDHLGFRVVRIPTATPAASGES